jgi:hypothetical protein
MNSLSQNGKSLALSNFSESSCGIAVSKPSLDPALVKMALEHGSPIVFLLILCYFFVLLTKFVKVCRGN